MGKQSHGPVIGRTSGVTYVTISASIDLLFTLLLPQATLHAEFEAIDHILPFHPAPLSDVTLYVTVEPCVMCASALRQIGIGKVFYGCGNERFGGCGGVMGVNDESVDRLCPTRGRQAEMIALNSPVIDPYKPFQAWGGYYRDEAIMLLRRFYLSENSNGEPPISRPDQRILNIA